MKRHAVLIGAGPAGLTAALEFLRRSDIVPIVLEASDEIGGISRTIRYKGNRMDIGGHRFFSKSDRVMQWWMELLPPAVDETAQDGSHQVISYQNQSRALPSAQAPVNNDLVMLVRPRKSRIYFLRRFFAYPVTLTADTIRGLGILRTFRIGLSYLWTQFHQRKPERSLEDFLINRFGVHLYLTFFKSYTEKVWGVPLRRDERRVGRATHQGIIAVERDRALPESSIRKCKKTAGFGTKRHRNVADREVSVS